jgi:hypothetical protein
MSRRTFVQMLVDQLVEYDKSQASVARLGRDLGWDESKVQQVVNRAEEDSAVPVQRGPGGVVRYRGSERGSTVGLYFDVKRVIESYWAEDQHLRRPTVTITARGGRRGMGVWSHPDLVLAALPRRRRTRNDLADLHSIEVETYTGFDIRSIYQAHSQGRGANFSWVFFASSDRATPHLDRIEWAAEALNIGLVRFTRAGASGTYQVLRQADRRDVKPEDRAVFCRNTGALDSD